MNTDEQELQAVRRLLQEATAKVHRLEGKLEAAEEQGRQLEFAHQDLRELLRVLGMGDHARPQSPHEVFQEAIALAGSYRQLFLTSQKHILHVYGCAACHGEHHGIWTQLLKGTFPVVIIGATSDAPIRVECQRAYVCPEEHCVVWVSNESEETFNGCERSHG